MKLSPSMPVSDNVTPVNASNHLQLNQMNTHSSNRNSHINVLTVLMLAIGTMARSADTPTLKDAYKDHFYVGAAINRSITTGTNSPWRRLEQVNKDVALAKEQFNQVSPENDLKWALIHPDEGRTAMISARPMPT